MIGSIISHDRVRSSISGVGSDGELEVLSTTGRFLIHVRLGLWRCRCTESDDGPGCLLDIGYWIVRGSIVSDCHRAVGVPSL